MNSLIAQIFSKSRSSLLSGISRSMFYYERKERDQIFDKDLKYRIKDIVGKRPSHSSRRITAMLRSDGIRSGRNRIRRHMRHLDLIQTYKKEDQKGCAKINHCVNAKYNVGDRFHRDLCGWLWLGIPFCTHRSLFQKNKGISYILYGKNEGDDSGYRQCNILIVRDMNILHLALRSDNGSQLTSKGYENYLKSLIIYHETIHAHTPEEDGHIESYFGHFKEDNIYSREFIKSSDDSVSIYIGL